MPYNRRIELLKNALEPEDIIRHMRYNGLAIVTLARIMDVHYRMAYRWETGLVHCRRLEELNKLKAVVVTLREGGLTEEGVGQWFSAKNGYLNGITPLEYLVLKQYDVVLEAAQAFAEGNYI